MVLDRIVNFKVLEWRVIFIEIIVLGVNKFVIEEKRILNVNDLRIYGIMEFKRVKSLKIRN